MTAAVTTAEAVAGLLALFVIVVAVLTLVRVLLKREDSAWHQMRIGFFVERDRSKPERDPELEVYDWEQPPPEHKDGP